ncbi:hypothetical protein Tco_0350055 [Tanacetum coccineum]
MGKFGCCKCKQMGKQPANACLQMQASIASFNCKLQMQAAIVSCKCKLQMLACNLQMLATYKCLQMQSANACLQTGTSCKFKLQLQDANACLQPANACLQMQASIV